MDIISRGFSSRRSAAEVKLPPGQYLTTDFPVLSAGSTPHVSLERWEFVSNDGTNVLRRWDWKSFRDLRCDGRGQPEAEDGATGKGRSGESDQPDATSLEE